jgi:hypothetical protein
MSEYYQQLDRPHFDYQLGTVPGLGATRFRGPIPDLGRPFVACLGAAQTFGRFVKSPFPEQLSRRLGVPVLNLGVGGVGPRFWLQSPYQAVLGKAQLVVVQVMAGRSASNSMFDNSATGDLKGTLLATGARMRFEEFLARLLATADRTTIERVVAETRADYVASMLALGNALARTPTVLMWMSQRVPEYQLDLRSEFGIQQAFPQLLDRPVVESIRPAFGNYVESVCASGIPQPLWPGTAAIDGAAPGPDGLLYNRYYPSPEMHDFTVDRLEPICRRLLG